jgi:hypothetical protein
MVENFRPANRGKVKFGELVEDPCQKPQKCLNFHRPAREIVARHKNDSLQGKRKHGCSSRVFDIRDSFLLNSDRFKGLVDLFNDSAGVTFVQTQQSTHSWPTKSYDIEGSH